MKLKLLLVLLSLFCFSAMADKPKTHLVVWEKDGTKVKYALAENLKITFTSAAMIVINNGVKSSYLLDDMLRFTYESILGDGDVNGDGKVDFVDIITTISHIMGENPSNFSPEAADMNGDGKINVVDITIMIDIIFGKNSITPPVHEGVTDNLDDLLGLMFNNSPKSIINIGNYGGCLYDS